MYSKDYRERGGWGRTIEGLDAPKTVYGEDYREDHRED